MGHISPVMVINTHRQRLDGYLASLYTAVTSTVLEHSNMLALFAGKLDTLSPLKVLGRGYALAYKEGALLHDAALADIGGKVEVRLQKGSLSCTVEKITV